MFIKLKKMRENLQNTIILRWFAAYLKPLDEEEMNDALKLGNIYANIIHLDCKYNKNIIDQLNEYGENIPFYTPL